MLPIDEARGQQQQRSAPQAGRMTAVMRAVLPSREGQRVLRIGMVKAGRFVEEHIIKARATVSIGPGEDATLIHAGLAATHRLFEISAGVYYLNLLPTMSGKIALDDGIHSIGEILGQTRRLRLSDATRGRIALGDTTLIFQFVDRPIAPARPRLPLAVKQGLFEAADWRLTIIVAFSFLAHFGVIGAMYSDWSDPVVDDGWNVRGLIDLVPTVPSPIVEAPPDTMPELKKDAVPSPTPTPVTNDKTPQKRDNAPDHQVRRPVDNTAALVDEGERMRMSMMLSFTQDTAVSRALDRDLPPIMLAHPDANVTTDGALSLHTDAPATFNKNHVDLATYVNGHAEAHDHTTPTNPSKDPAPSFSVDTGPPLQASPVPSVERTIAQLRPAFRRCYEQGLQSNSGMSGDLMMRIKIRPNGEVESASAVSNNGLSPQVAQCIAGKVLLAQFEAPHGSGSSIDVPVKFVKQR